MPRYVRKQPLKDRLAAYLNPYDFLLWLSEEVESNGWDQLEKEWAIPVGFGLNLIFLIARANTGTYSSGYDDVFGDGPGFGWLAWFVSHPAPLNLLSLCLTVYQVYIHCPFPDTALAGECSLYFLAKEALSPV